MKQDYKKLIDDILNNSHPNTAKIHETLHTQVYLIDEEPKLIVKFDRQDIKQIQSDKQLLDALDRGDDLTSLIYYITPITLDGEPYVCTVSKHLPGKALADYPTKDQTILIMKAVHEFVRRMHVVSDKFRDMDIPSLREVLLHQANHAPECFSKTKLDNLLKNPEFNKILDTPEQYLFHGDLWRENILITENHVSIIDLTPIFYGPKQMQVAILFSAYFKLKSILLGKEEAFQLDSLIKEWASPINRKELLQLMYIFPVSLGLGKEQSFVENPVSEEEYHSIIDPLNKIIHYLDEEFEGMF